MLPKGCSERQNLLEVARTAKSCFKRGKLLKSCRAQSVQAYQSNHSAFFFLDGIEPRTPGNNRLTRIVCCSCKKFGELYLLVIVYHMFHKQCKYTFFKVYPSFNVFFFLFVIIFIYLTGTTKYTSPVG